MVRSKIAAFFDFDNTLLNGESAALGIRYLWDEGYRPVTYTLKVLLAYQLYKRDLLPMHKMSRACLSYYKGKSLKRFVDGSKKFYDSYIKPNLSKPALDKLKHHREKGHMLVLLSGSIDYYLKHVKEDLGFDQILCTVLQVNEKGICTGKTSGPMLVGNEKKRVAIEFAARNGIALPLSYAYADHHSDINLMEAVGHPVAVKPNEKLRTIATKRNWPVL